MRELVNRPQRFSRVPAAARGLLGVLGLVFFSLFVGAMLAFLPPGFVIRLLAVPLFLGFIAIAWLMRSASAGLPGPWTISLLMATAALSVIWPRYIFFSIGGPFVNPLTLGIFLSLALTMAWIAYSPALNARMGGLAKNSGGVLWIIAAWIVWRLLASLAGQYPEASTIEFLRDQIYLSSFLLIGWVLVARPNGVQSLMRMLTACALFVTLAGCIEAVLQKNYFIQFAAGRDSLAVAATLKTIAIDKFRDGGFRIQSTFDHPIVFAQFIAAMVPLALYVLIYDKKIFWRSVALGFLVPCLYALYKTGARSGVVSLAACFVLLLVIGWLKLIRSQGFGKAIAFAALPVVVLGFGLIYVVVQELVIGRSRVEAGSSSVRLQMLMLGINALRDSPILGYGYGSAVSKAGFFDRIAGTSTIDSLLLSVAVDSGYVGLALFLLIVGILLFKGVLKTTQLTGTDSVRVAMLVSGTMAVFTTFITLSITSNLTLFWLIFMASLAAIAGNKPKPAFAL